jgi:chromosome segregation ATPase
MTDLKMALEKARSYNHESHAGYCDSDCLLARALLATVERAENLAAENRTLADTLNDTIERSKEARAEVERLKRDIKIWEESRERANEIFVKIRALLEKAEGALRFYAKGRIDLEPRPEKEHLYAKDYPMDSPEWRQRSMSDHWPGKIARAVLTEIEAAK